MEPEQQTFSHQLERELAAVEQRDWELWILVLVTVGILAGAFFLIIFPAVFRNERTIYIRADVSPQLLLGLLVLILMFGIYLVRKHFEIRSLRFKSMKNAWNSEVSRVHLLIDPLTKVFNRAALEEILSKEIKRAQRKQATLTFMYIDVNNFKEVNTRFGHLSGDLVLAEAGGILKQCTRGSDFVIRLGGDEFLVTLVDTTRSGAEPVKNRINQKVEAWNRNSPLPGFTLSLSIGIQEYDGTQSFDEVLAAADAKMYAEKNARPGTDPSPVQP